MRAFYLVAIEFSNLMNVMKQKYPQAFAQDYGRMVGTRRKLFKAQSKL